MPNISAKINNFEISSPIILASGILDESSGSILRALKQGAGAAVTKSIGSVERIGYSTPVISVLPTGMLNAVGLPNPGIDAFSGEFKAFPEKARVVVSIFGSTPEEFLSLAKRVEKLGFKVVELNLSCPHVVGVGSEVGQDANLVEEVTNVVKKETSLEVWAKLTPNVTDIVKIAKAAEGADAYVLINTLKGIGVDIYSKQFLLSNKIGGYSGPGIKPVALRAVYDVFKETEKDIVGVGGITSWEDAVEFILLGAKAVQIGTGIYYEDYAIFDKINKGISSYLEEQNISRLEDIVGIAVK